MPTAEQKKAIGYFNPKGGCPGGCIEALTGMKDADYEQMVVAKLNSLNLKQKAIAKIGLDEDQLKEIPPIFFHGYHFIDKNNPSYRLGKDNRVRSSKYDATWLFFSGTQVYMYQYIFDMLEDWRKESTEEYFYKDITNFSTATETVSVNGKSVTVNQFQLVVPGDKFYCSTTGVPDADRAINAMKQKLREKKG